MQNLNKRKMLASKVLGVGKNKILFNTENLSEIREAITKQDIRDMYEQGMIMIRETRGRRIKVKRKTRRGPGKIKRKIKKGKKEYVIMVRKLRRYVKELKNQGKIDINKYKTLRKQIRSRAFRDKAHLKEQIGVKK